MAQLPFAERVSSITGSLIDQIVSTLAERGGSGRADTVSFGAGSPGAEALPVGVFQRLSEIVLAEKGCPALNYGQTEGDVELRRVLLEETRRRDFSVEPEQLTITAGAMQGLDLVCKLFVDPGDIVAIECPGFSNAIATIRSYQGSLLAVPVDGDGMMVDEMARLCKEGSVLPKLIYVNPTYQNPTGASLSLDRRRKLLSFAEEIGAVVLEDDPYGWLGFDGTRLPTLYGLSGGAEWVIGVHTFSKVISPGIRVGWCVAASEVIRKMVEAKQAMDTCTNMLAQRLVAVFLREGLMEAHLEWLRQMYKAKSDAMVAALRDVFGDVPEASWTLPEGGFFVWLRLAEGIDTMDMLPIALGEGVAYVPGKAFTRRWPRE